MVSKVPLSASSLPAKLSDMVALAPRRVALELHGGGHLIRPRRAFPGHDRPGADRVGAKHRFKRRLFLRVIQIAQVGLQDALHRGEILDMAVLIQKGIGS